jgi:hypothetical protein
MGTEDIERVKKKTFFTRVFFFLFCFRYGMLGKNSNKFLSNVIVAQVAATPHTVGTVRTDLPPLRIPTDSLKGE